MSETQSAHGAGSWGDETAALLDEAARCAGETGWSEAALREALDTTGRGAGAYPIVFAQGVAGALRDWSALLDARAEAVLAGGALEGLRVREKAAVCVMARLEAGEASKPAHAAAIRWCAPPHRAPVGAAMVWASADMMWRAMGDASNDFNWYSKRAILSGVISSTSLVWLKDHDPALAETRAFLARRIENVMQFEKVKAQAKSAADAAPDLTQILARWRYGAS